MSNANVIVGMSGGVDSSVAALILKEQGYQVSGIFMKNWEEVDENGVCPSEIDYGDVVKVCENIGINYHTLNFAKEYRAKVFDEFIEGLKSGDTPNPDILCNREIKFKVFLEQVENLGAEYLATGHYCQKKLSEKTGNYQLIRAKDESKDQTYFLYTITSDILKRVLFPIGDMLKKEVRASATLNHLSTFNKKDSTGICFIGEKNFRNFINQYIAYTKGAFQTLDGTVVGEHYGVAFYTIGQRKGLALGGAGAPWFVVDKDIKKNIVYVERGEEHPHLFSDSLEARELHFIDPRFTEDLVLPYRCTAKIRYRQKDEACTIMKIENGRVWVTFDRPQRAITLMQAIVFYQGEVCLGGATIDKNGPTQFELNKLH